MDSIEIPVAVVVLSPAAYPGGSHSSSSRSLAGRDLGPCCRCLWLGNARIVFVTDWKAQAEHGGFYEAVAMGLYASTRLDVPIREGGPSVNVPQLIAGGAADFGIGSNSFMSAQHGARGRAGARGDGGVPEGPGRTDAHPRNDVSRSPT